MQDFSDDIIIKDQSGKFLKLRDGELLQTKEPTSSGAGIKQKEIIEDIIRESGIKFSDKNLDKRLRDIILSRVNNSRDRLETKENLLKSRDKGGLSLDEESAEKVVNITEKYLQSPDIFHPEKKPAPEPLEKVSKKSYSQINWGNIADEIMIELKVAASGDKKDKLKKAITTYLRDVRDKIELKDVLSKEESKGGLGLASDKIDRIIEAADKKKAVKIPSKSLPKTRKIEKTPPQRGNEIKRNVLSKEEKEKKRIANKPSPEKEHKKPVIAPPPPAKKSPEMDFGLSKRRTILTGKRGFEDKEQIKPRPQKKKQPEKKVSLSDHYPNNRSGQKSVEPNSTPKRPKLQDVKYEPKLVGPVEELKRMTLGDLRKISADPETAAERIKDKINVLGEESLGKKIQGIKAWRQSPIYKMYLELGQKSLKSGLPVGKITEELGQDKEKSLTEEEFNAIMKLNKELRF